MRQGNNSHEPPVEYSFMGEHSSSTSIAGHGGGGEANIFSPQPQPQQPLFWLRKDVIGSTPPPPPPPPHHHHHHQNNMQLVASVCAWCRNLFLHEPLLLGSETAMCCPTCRSRIPAHFNLL
ncbi:hypothetical protein M569_14413 [Genlisea aurea]|uniref:Uncharacterized protein n=1 Tax=Genlisea aurea TaxID=192259 RepID=S8C0T1_9LAMI|nr:hypothetical protein M569_14413 [Genlisea aurea]